MLFSANRIFLLLAVIAAAGWCALAQNPPAPAGPRVEPGLERAVKWIWRVEPSPRAQWGLQPPPDLPVAPAAVPNIPNLPPVPGIPRATAVAPSAGGTYTIKRGDALILIARRFRLTVAQIKAFNGLAADTIRAGQILRIPTQAEAQAIAPAPTPTAKPAAGKRPAENTPAPVADDLATLTVQVFLDREGFSVGPLDGRNNPTFQKMARLYQGTLADANDPAALQQRAQAAVVEPLTRYTLKLADFRFIAPPRAQAADPKATPPPAGKHRPAAAPTSHQAKPTYQELTSAPMLAYRTPWEFVAERFHCDEAYLRSLNAQIRDVPTVGTELRVPNVVPFEIARSLDEPLQPTVNSASRVTAAVVDLSVLEISRGGAVVAAMPLSMARPGLRGRDAWTILDAIPRPRLVTRQELRVKPQPVERMFGRENPDATPPPAPTPLPAEQILAAGPNNPVGILWINLAKAGSTEPLPYGLHGTSIPDQMATQESLGGIRLTNWDIARAGRLLPPGTPLAWRQSNPVPPAR